MADNKVIEVPALEELLLHFESFGDNCEFGVMQRQAGCEPLGLFRFADSSAASLLAALDSGFKGVGERENIELTISRSNEFIVNIKSYAFKYHTRRYEGEVDPEVLRQEEAAKQRFLVRRLLNTLRAGDKIVVRRGSPVETLDDAEALLTALRRHGPVTLLWVTEADEHDAARSVRLIADNLIGGRVGKLTPYHDAHSLEFTSWVDICRGAYMLWKSKAEVGTVAAPPVRNDFSSNVLSRDYRRMHIDSFPHVQLLKENISSETICGNFPLRSKADQAICRNVLLSEQTGAIGFKVDGLIVGQIYTFSVWVRLPRDGQISAVHMMFAGRKTERALRVRLGAHSVWQQLEVTATAGPDGIMLPKLVVKGSAGAAFYMANWRLEQGIIIGEICPP